MPDFPGMGYPLVPGYESVGTVIDAGADVAHMLGQRVFVPGANCYSGARGLFGGAARRVVLPAARVLAVPDRLGRDAVLLSLAATAHHALPADGLPDLIVGHGVLGRLLARITVALGGAPTVWEIDPKRSHGAMGYQVVHPDADEVRGRTAIVDVSGDAGIIDTAVGRLARRGTIILAGFYDRLSFAFPPAFQKEASIRIAAEFTSADLAAVSTLLDAGTLGFDGLVSHVRPANEAADAYPQAFEDRECLKMVIDWRECA
jgi:3-hydroxyethyl bacteriochlorophyllide a dehydrogenase